MRIALIIVLLIGYTFSTPLPIKYKSDAGLWATGTHVYTIKGQSVSLMVDSIPGGSISWYQIIPDIIQLYKNANHPWEKDPYKWIGFANIKYFREELVHHRGKWEINPLLQNNSFSSPYYYDDLGSFWIQAVVVVSGDTLSSAGLMDNTHKGLSPEVFRISICESNSYIGYVTSYLNVPGIFGSVPYQCRNYIGADCADVLLAAFAHWQGNTLTKDYNVAMIVNQFPKVAACNIKEGVPDKNIAWDDAVKQGDFIAIRYEGSRQYQHIGALYKDANKNGVLDAPDLILHAGPLPLHHDRLDAGGFDGHVVILRAEK